MDITIAGVSGVVIVGILVEVIKRAGIKVSLLPLASLIAGVVVTFLGTWSISVEGLVAGIVIGAIASGAYDNISKGAKAIKGK